MSNVKRDSGWDELRLAIFRQAVSDHRKTKYESRQIQIERWILSCPFMMDSDICEQIVRRLRCRS